MERGGFRSWDLNIICIAAASVSLLSAFLPWTFTDGELAMVGDVSAVEYAFDLDNVYVLEWGYYPEDWSVIVAGTWLFLAGMLLSFISPLGGVVQLLGLLAFYSKVWTGQSPGPSTPAESVLVVSQSFEVGFYLAMASSCAVVVSITLPVGRRLTRTRLPFRRRLLTVLREVETIP